jgi:hypothetical protein
MRCRDSGSSILYYDHRTANSATVTRDVNGTMMIVDVYAHKLTETPSPPKFSELFHKVQRIPGKPNDSTVHVNHESMGSVYFRSSGETNV